MHAKDDMAKTMKICFVLTAESLAMIRFISYRVRYMPWTSLNGRKGEGHPNLVRISAGPITSGDYTPPLAPNFPWAKDLHYQSMMHGFAWAKSTGYGNTIIIWPDLSKIGMNWLHGFLSIVMYHENVHQVSQRHPIRFCINMAHSILHQLLRIDPIAFLIV
jgi:hypothetical protein